MHKYFLKRILFLIPIILSVTFIVFAILHFSPVDPAVSKVGEGGTQEQIDYYRDLWGLNKNFFVRYFDYMKGVLVGDFGLSYQTETSVLQEIVSAFPYTLILTVTSMLVAIVIAIPIGIVSAVKQYSALDKVGTLSALLGVSMPNFWFGTLLIMYLSIQFGLFPVGGVYDGALSYVLPAITLGTGAAAVILRMTRSSMLEVIRQDYIVTARAKGVSEGVVIRKHAFKNASIPVVTVIGLQFGYLLGGAVLTESVFALPGVGSLLVKGMQQLDTPLILAGVIFMAVVFTIVNLLVDFIYAYLDPRIKAQYTKK